MATIIDNDNGNVLDGTAGADQIHGNGGDDTINQTAGLDYYYGGDDTDTLVLTLDVPHVDFHNDSIVLPGGTTFQHFSGIEIVDDQFVRAPSDTGPTYYSSDRDETVIRGNGNSFFHARGGDDLFEQRTVTFSYDDTISYEFNTDGSRNSQAVFIKLADTVAPGNVYTEWSQYGYATVALPGWGAHSSFQIEERDDFNGMNHAVGGDGNDVIVGSYFTEDEGGPGHIYGSTVWGRGGNDFIRQALFAYGEDGDDTYEVLAIRGGGFEGGEGNDRMLVSTSGTAIVVGTPAGTMYFDGGEGIDTIEINATLNFGLVIDLAGVVGNFFNDGVIALVNVENVIGGVMSDHIFASAIDSTVWARTGDDIIDISGGLNGTFYGEGGNDRFVVGSGTDHIDGGADTDRLDFEWSNAGVTVDLDAGTGAGGWAQGDTYVDVENIDGSDHDDTLTGDEAVNVLRGLDGNDTLEGGAGDDELNGGAGTDVAVYSGVWDDYLVTVTGGGYTIEDLRSGSPEGTDTLASIETIRFADGDYAIETTPKSAPTVTEIADKTAKEGTAFNFDVADHFSDSNLALGDTLTFSALGLPAWLTMDVATGVLSGTPGIHDAAAATTVTVSATDGNGDAASQAFLLTVLNTNQAPSSTAMTSKTASEDVDFAFDASAHFDDVDIQTGDSLTFSASGMPAWLSIDATTGVLSGKPGFNDAAGAKTVTVTATDEGGLSTSRSFSLTVADTNRSPTGPSLSSTEVAENLGAGTVVGTLSITDQDGPAATYALTSNPGSLFQIVGNELRLAKALDFETEASHGITVKATDPSGAETTKSFTIAVVDVVDQILGSDKNDLLEGAKGADKIVGLGGSDRMFGRDGADDLRGGKGSDTLVGGADGDVLDGNNGRDTASYADATKKVVANLGAPNKNKGDAKGDGYSSIENLTGTDFNDALTGDDGANVLQGGRGKDKLHGGKGPDELVGGGDGDTFLFRSLSDSSAGGKNRDTIVDFSRKDGDTIHLRGIDAKTGKKNQAFDFIGDDVFSGKKGELRFEKQDKKTFVQGDVDGDARADFSIAIGKAVNLKDGDFVL